MRREELIAALSTGDASKPSAWRKQITYLVFLIITSSCCLAAYIFYPAKPAINVEIVRATSGQDADPKSTLEASGYIVANQQATVSSKITGKLVFAPLEEGQTVEKGDVLARLDDSNAKPAWLQAQATLKAAEVALTDLQPVYDRNFRLHEQHLISEDAFDKVKANFDAAVSAVKVGSQTLQLARANLDDVVITAPFSGVITAKSAQIGEMVSPISAGGGFTRTGICTIIDMQTLEIKVDVAERFIHLVTPRMKAIAKLTAYPNWSFPAHVKVIVPTADSSKGTVTVRLSIDAPDSRIMPQMGVSVAFQDNHSILDDTTKLIVLPRNAVLRARDGTSHVFVKTGDRVRQRKVTLGTTYASEQSVVGGLKPGEIVVVGNNIDRLTDGAKVHAANE